MPDLETMITLYKINQNNYEVQFSINPMLKDKIEKKHQLKKWLELGQDNLPNLWPRSWDQDNPLENKL